MVVIRKLFNEFSGPDGHAVPLRMPRRPKQPGPQARPGTKSINRRFERRLRDFPPPTPQDTPCVLWQGAVDHYGYGSIKQYFPNGGKRTVKVHRWIIEQAFGIVLRPDQTILHLCDNPPCFRVSHLRIGTIAENNADMMAKGRAKPPPINRLYGEANPNTKVTPTQRGELFERWLIGESVESLALTYGIGKQRVQAIIKELRSEAPPAAPSERSAPVKSQEDGQEV